MLLDLMDTISPSPNSGTESAPPRPDFKSLFCQLHHCPTEEFEERAFRACLYWRARPLAPILRAIAPRYFDPDFAFIGYLAKAPGRRDAMNELAAFVEAKATKAGFARKFLLIRISPRKTSQLIARVFEHSAQRREPAPGPQM
jgi:hypothetical protein